MGTRADFYVGRGVDAKWLGSIAWDGYPSGIPDDILSCQDEDTYQKNVNAFLMNREDGTLPEMGWPWPWESSDTTDYAYAFDGKKVWISYFGSGWAEKEDDIDSNTKKVIFPNMKSIQNVNFGKRSGIIIIQRNSQDGLR